MTDLPPAGDPELVREAWSIFDPTKMVMKVHDISATVSTNRVYRMELSDGHEVIAKTSSYGSYIHFRQDHQLIQQWIRLLGGTRFSTFLANILGKPGGVFTYRQGHRWVAFYEKAQFYDFLPKVLSDGQIDSMAQELAEFHRVSSRAAQRMNPTWKTLGSDIAALHEVLGNHEWCRARGFDQEAEKLLRLQCESFLVNAEQLGYHGMQRIPVLVDWNIGNFSVGFDGDGFKLFSRWDYDWFRIEPRVLDFYFAARVCRSEGDQTLFSYFTRPLFEQRFIRFLREYHRVSPLREEELLFMKEAYRFFILNYVIKDGEHFFRPSYCRRLQQEAVEQYLPQLDSISFNPLLEALD